MESVFITLNSNCTRECSYCFYNTGHQKKREELLSVESITSFCTTLKGNGLKSLIFTGGEPLLFSELSELIEWMKKSDFYTLLITNGDLLTDKKKRELQQNGLSAITVSLHIESNSKKELEEKMQKISKGIELPLTFIFTQTSVNYELADKALTIAKKMGKGLILQSAYIPSSSDISDTLSLKNLFRRNKDLIGKFKKDIVDWSEEFNSYEYAKLFLSLFSENPENPVFCPMGTNVAVLNCDGEVIPCFHREDLSIGNIIKDDINSIAVKIDKFSKTLCTAECFGEHCVSLFA